MSQEYVLLVCYEVLYYLDATRLNSRLFWILFESQNIDWSRYINLISKCAELASPTWG